MKLKYVLPYGLTFLILVVGVLESRGMDPEDADKREGKLQRPKSAKWRTQSARSLPAKGEESQEGAAGVTPTFPGGKDVVTKEQLRSITVDPDKR